MVMTCIRAGHNSFKAADGASRGPWFYLQRFRWRTGRACTPNNASGSMPQRFGKGLFEKLPSQIRQRFELKERCCPGRQRLGTSIGNRKRAECHEDAPGSARAKKCRRPVKYGITPITSHITGRRRWSGSPAADLPFPHTSDLRTVETFTQATVGSSVATNSYRTSNSI